MIYMDAAKLSDLISTENHKNFCNRAGISNQVLYRLLYHGGPIKVTTAMKVCTALGTSLESLLDRNRTPTFTRHLRAHSESRTSISGSALESVTESGPEAQPLTGDHARNTR